MHKSFKVYLILILFFAFDKLLYIPGIKTNFTKVSKIDPYSDSLLNLPYTSFSGKKNHIFTFGSSRSFGFYTLPVDKTTDSDPYLEKNEKSFLKDWEFHNFASPGANFTVHYTRLVQIWNQGHRPNAVLLEVSPFSFTPSSRFHQIAKMESVPLDFLVKNYLSFPTTTRRDILLSKLAASYRYKLDLLRWKNEKQSDDPLVGRVTDGMMQSNQDIINIRKNLSKFKQNLAYTKFDDYAIGKIPETEYFLKFLLLNQIYTKEFFRDYSIDPDQVFLLEKIIEFCQEKNIALILWNPPVHPSLNDLRRDLGIHSIWEKYVRDIARDRSIPFMDFSEDYNLTCLYFTDSSHLSNRCFTELSFRLLSVMLPNWHLDKE
jgi:hypothetical protein